MGFVLDGMCLVGRSRFGSRSLRSLLWTFFVFASLPGFALAQAPLVKANLRVGEASHPGPSCLIPFGCSNPSGLRNKESHVVELGPGVWMLSETQLSSVTQASSKQRLQSLGRASQRDIRVHHGAPAALRSNSLWAGAWSGVCTTSDWTSSSLTLPWPSGLYQLGRAQVIQHVIESLPVVTATVYGFCTGGTHPHALEQTNELLAPSTPPKRLAARCSM